MTVRKALEQVPWHCDNCDTMNVANFLDDTLVCSQCEDITTWEDALEGTHLDMLTELAILPA